MPGQNRVMFNNITAENGGFWSLVREKEEKKKSTSRIPDIDYYNFGLLLLKVIWDMLYSLIAYFLLLLCVIVSFVSLWPVSCGRVPAVVWTVSSRRQPVQKNKKWVGRRLAAFCNSNVFIHLFHKSTSFTTSATSSDLTTIV